jgi:hypothetical protein
MDLQLAGDGRGIYHCLVEEDIERIMKHPRVMHASDGSTMEFGKAKPHPRSYGTFPRVLGRYVREKNVISLEEAIRKMTSLPAQRLELEDRGILKEGMWADVVVFDPQTVNDQATWTEPHQFPVGILYVLVNGKLVVDEGKWTGDLPGKVLYGPEKNEGVDDTSTNNRTLCRYCHFRADSRSPHTAGRFSVAMRAATGDDSGNGAMRSLDELHQYRHCHAGFVFAGDSDFRHYGRCAGLGAVSWLEEKPEKKKLLSIRILRIARIKNICSA